MYYMLMLVLVGCAVPVNGHTLHSTDSVLVVQASRCTACLRCAVPKQGVVWWESKLEKELRWERSCRSCAESALARACRTSDDRNRHFLGVLDARFAPIYWPA